MRHGLVFFLIFQSSILCSYAGSFLSPFAGTWYPKEQEQLTVLLDDLFSSAKASKIEFSPNVLIVPHSAYPFCGKIAASGYRHLTGKSFQRVIVLSANHRGSRQGMFLLDADEYVTPLGKVKLDRQAMVSLLKDKRIGYDNLPFMEEHSVDLQLPFLQKTLGTFSLVPIIVENIPLSDMSDFGNILTTIIDEKTLVVVTTDMTHYGERFGYLPGIGDKAEVVLDRLHLIDLQVIGHLTKADYPGLIGFFRANKTTICGFIPLSILLNILTGGSKGKMLDYGTSYEQMKDFKTVVSYVSIALAGKFRSVFPTELVGQDETELLKMARDSMRLRVYKQGELRMNRYRISPAMKEYRGAFVTLLEDNVVKGSMGTVYDARQLYQTVIAGVDEVVSLPELSSLFDKEGMYERIKIAISIVKNIRPMRSISELESGKHGVFLTTKDQVQLLLPRYAKDSDLKEAAFLDALCSKAALTKSCWEKTKVYLFETIEISEK